MRAGFHLTAVTFRVLGAAMQRLPPHVGGYGLVLRALQRTFAIMPAADDTKALHPLQLGIPTFDIAS